jgi:hypothetical protein
MDGERGLAVVMMIRGRRKRVSLFWERGTRVLCLVFQPILIVSEKPNIYNLKCLAPLSLKSTLSKIDSSNG